MVTEDYIREVLRIVRCGKWPNGVPHVSAGLRLMVNSLTSQDPRIFTKDAAAIVALINQDNNVKTRAALADTPADALALAITEAS